jgi:hypothetical protein
VISRGVELGDVPNPIDALGHGHGRVKVVVTV